VVHRAVLHHTAGAPTSSSDSGDRDIPKSDVNYSGEGYAPVADRVRLFYERYPAGRIVTHLVRRTDEEVVFRAEVFRSPSDREPAATGWAAEREGDGEINTVACLENTETSAVGRALANLGLVASRYRPSREEMEKADRARARVRGVAEQQSRRTIARAAERHRVRCVDEAPVSYPAHAPGDDADASAVRERTTPWWDLAVAAGSGRELWDEPPAAFIGLPDDVDAGRYVALSVAGESMAPLLHTGDTILVRLGPELAADQVVVARHPEQGYVVKRVGRVSPMRVELASLNAEYPALEIPNDASLVLGTVVLRWCPHERRGLTT
jgi:hypothetical protein